MADELNIQAQFQFAKDNSSLNNTVSATLSVSGDNFTSLTQEVLTTETAMEYGSVDPEHVGFILLQNIGLYDVKLRFQDPGEQTFVLKAGTADQPGGIFLAQGFDADADTFEVLMQAVGTASRVSVTLIEE